MLLLGTWTVDIFGTKLSFTFLVTETSSFLKLKSVVSFVDFFLAHNITSKIIVCGVNTLDANEGDESVNVIDRIERGEITLQLIPNDGTWRHAWDKNDCYKDLLRLAKIGHQMQWVPVSERLPENTKKKCYIDPKVVLCTDGKEWYKAYYVRHHEVNCEDMGYEGDGEYDEETDNYYWPEGWYECSSEHEDIDWALGAKITHWMELPLPETGEGE